MERDYGVGECINCGVSFQRTNSRHKRCEVCGKLRRQERSRGYREAKGPNPHLKHTYGIDLDDKVAMLGGQGFRCAICATGVDLSSGHVDHDHGSGVVRGILCGDCNRALGLFKDDEINLMEAITYLRSHHG